MEFPQIALNPADLPFGAAISLGRNPMTMTLRAQTTHCSPIAAGPRTELASLAPRALGKVWRLLIDMRKAWAAERLHQVLSSRPDGELARYGLRRAVLARHIWERLHSDASAAPPAGRSGAGDAQVGHATPSAQRRATD